MAKLSTKVIFSQSLAGYLMLKGNSLLGIDKNYKYPTKNVFIFNNTERIAEDMDGWKPFLKQLNRQ